jgi:hypothetical protein
MDFLPLLQGQLDITGATTEQIYAHCPFHDDHDPSLSIQRHGGAWTCHAKCGSGSGAQLLAKLGLPPLPAEGNGASLGTIVATYDYRDEQGTRLFQVVRLDPKAFRQRRPDGTGGWVWNMNEVRRVLYRLPDLHHQEMVVIAEGEKDVDRLWALGIAATTNPGGAGKWRDEYAAALRTLGVQEVAILPDHDDAGQQHADTVAVSCRRADLHVKIVALPGLAEKEDASNWLDAGHTRAELDALIAAAPEFDGLPTTGPWARAKTAAEFLAEDEPYVGWLIENQFARGSLTQWFSPRGIGKTHVAHAYAVKLARTGLRVLLIDRDNARREIRRRLTAWGASGLTTLKVLTRDDAPPLTKREAWTSFPFDGYDLVIVDSLDASTEGVGEKDSAKPSQALAVLLDLAHRANGPAILVLGNTVKSAAHSRGSGVIEDRADIVYEVRDCTNFRPSGKKASWWLDLPPQGVAEFGNRAERRQQQQTYRLAYIPSKFRTGQEPDPFVVEVDLAQKPWTIRDATAAMGVMVQAAREAITRQRATAVLQLRDEVQRRIVAGLAPFTSKKAEAYLMQRRLSQDQARAIVHDPAAPWALKPVPGPGNPKVLRPRPPSPGASQ